jgi:hypothetical protein
MPPLLLIGLATLFLFAKNAKQKANLATAVDATVIPLARTPPDFPIPTIETGDYVKVTLLDRGGHEHIWVKITNAAEGNGPHMGVLAADSALIDRLHFGSLVKVYSKNVQVRVRGETLATVGRVIDGCWGDGRVGTSPLALARKGPHAPHVIPGQKIIVKRGSKVVTHLANDTRETAHEEGRAAAAKSLAANLTDLARHPMHANNMVRDERRAARRDRRSGTVDPTREVMNAAADRLAGLILDAEWEIAK